jgi:aryl-alcohol dehydrogenase-like predicted oxidoreductase
LWTSTARGVPPFPGTPEKPLPAEPREDVAVAREPECGGADTGQAREDAAASQRILDAFVEAGGNLIDTADSYSHWVPGNSGGESETILGEWTRSRGNRDSVIIATKVSRHPEFPGLAPENIAKAADDLAVFPYWPLAGGFLTGKYRSEADLAGRARGAAVQRHLTDDGFHVLDALDAVASAHGTSPATVALAWLLAKPTVTAPLASATSVEQLAELVAAPPCT